MLFIKIEFAWYFLVSRMTSCSRGLNPLKDAIHHVKMGKDKDTITERYINPTKGRGVFAKTLIFKGSFILEYRGTLIEKGDFDEILNEYAYFFNHQGHDYCIDASYDDGSLGRLVNDDERPNAKMRKIVDVDGKPHLCLFAIKDINEGVEITYDYGGYNLPWRSRHEKEHCKHLHEPVTPAMTACDITSPKKHLHEPVTPAMTACDIISPTKDIIVRSKQESRRPGSGDDERGRKRKKKTVGMRRRETSRVCKTHQLVKEEMNSLEKCSLCSGPFSPLKWWGLKCKVCSTALHVYCFHKRQKAWETDRSEESDEECDTSEESDEEYVPDSKNETDDESTNTMAKSPFFIKESQLGCSTTGVDINENFNGGASANEKSIDNENFNGGGSAHDKSMDKTSEDTIKSTAVETSDTVQKTAVSFGGQNICFVCQKPVFKIARHFKTHIKEDGDIAKALSLPAGSKTRKELLEKLRNRGNFMHNNEVLKSGSGSLKVKRKAKGDSKKYEYCIHCKGMFLRHELWRHMKRCSSKPGDSEHHGRKYVLGLAALVKASCSSTENGVLKMISHMHDDEISTVVRNDFCLLRFAESLYSKHGHDPSKHDYIRQKIRQVGRFLQTLHKISPIMTLEDSIKPQNFMTVIKAVQVTAGFDKNTNSYKTPSLALKIGHSLLKVSDIVRCHALMAGNEDLIKSSEAFQKLYQAKWSEYISHCALTTISDSKYNKPDNLPLTEDIKKLHQHLDKSAELATAALKEVATAQNYSSLARTILTKIVLFNRRRIGEVSKMKLMNFLQRDHSHTHEGTGLSNYEQKLCRYFERVELKGKRGRKVAVLLTPDMTNALNLLIANRKECSVPEENDYLFAVPQCLTYYRGHESLRRLADECGAQKPDCLRSTKLRKEIATTSQILNLKDNELDQLADFLGHDISVHRQFYRLSEPKIQSGKISKLLLALEKGKLHELHGKSLDQIGDFTDEDEEDDSEDEETIPPENALEEDASTEMNVLLERRPCLSTSKGPKAAGQISEDNGLLERRPCPSTSGLKAYRHISENNVSSRGRRMPKRRPWTKPEVNAVMRHFKLHISKAHLATMRECEVCKRCEHPVLQNRSVQNIRDFVRNRGLNLKRMGEN
ncbi:uncharacterized protein LOC130549867 isoform X3 [Triplophysa rosa]|uniref:uncharacterized protein LOC130549867 isoform X3 n=1 Tax=Triplophysa rosa TaxID=992332 RepID=UPI002545C892|nr:uncharacterized protein LOC130549867 isoform X3 [Triplophysa rosa]